MPVPNEPAKVTVTVFRCGLIAGLWLALGASAEAVSVSPTRIVHQGKPRQTLHGRFTVQNTGQERVEMRVQPEDWAGGIGGARGPVPWISVRPARFSLKPGKRATVTYTARIPKDATGEMRTQVFFSSGGASTNSPTSRVGAIIYVTIEGTEHVQGTIGEMKAFYTVGTPGATKPDRLELVASVQNSGNVHLIPEGEFIVRNEHGQHVLTLPLEPGWGLLPGQDDRYRVIGYGIYLLPGQYTIDANLKGGSDIDQPVTFSKTAQMRITESGELQLISPDAPPATP